jgi:molybdate-binding protein
MRRPTLHTVRGPVWAALFFAYFFAVTIPNAHAYLDPGTGSYVFQVLIGALLGAAVAIKVFWKRIWGFVTRKDSRPVSSQDQPTDRDLAKDE